MSACRAPPPIASSALHPSVPTRTPVAARCAAHLNDARQQQTSIRDCADIALQRPITVESFGASVAIVIALRIAAAQIPIDQPRS